jgi:hypothetical protein
MTNELEPAIGNVTASFLIWAEAGDATGLASAHDTVAVLEYYNAQRLDAEKHAERAVRIAEVPALEYASARAKRGFLAFQRNEFDLATACLQDACRIAEESGSEEVGLRGRVIADFNPSGLTNSTREPKQPRRLLRTGTRESPGFAIRRTG